MKKNILLAIAIISMTLASYADNTNALPCGSYGNNIESVENGRPHTEQYLAFKKAFDQFEKELKTVKSCDELEEAFLSFIGELLTFVEDFDDDAPMTDEEEQLLSDQAERIDAKITKLQEKWDCDDLFDE